MFAEAEDNTSSRVGGLIALFVVSLIASYLPTASQRLAKYGKNTELIFNLAGHFGTGIVHAWSMPFYFP